MADEEEKARQEKIAAARKRVSISVFGAHDKPF